MLSAACLSELREHLICDARQNPTESKRGEFWFELVRAIVSQLSFGRARFASVTGGL